ncbi:Regulator_of chromosome condensation 1/beta-lactamase-inhibitor protein II [Hexamita inflata]|uniref:Regulator of chromosome condensation 1/beta-lactamase-inhibitor protein II n=1 Tax=Hexamita inflata TaxID=28002 RepID=A0AA86Q4Q9_9EUKA|nr:Regulator of chromosome condensation 1/beta-lactamase-inhibitor protein II [Hexamita inflata]
MFLIVGCIASAYILGDIDKQLYLSSNTLITNDQSMRLIKQCDKVIYALAQNQSLYAFGQYRELFGNTIQTDFIFLNVTDVSDLVACSENDLLYITIDNKVMEGGYIGGKYEFSQIMFPELPNTLIRQFITSKTQPTSFVLTQEDLYVVGQCQNGICGQSQTTDLDVLTKINLIWNDVVLKAKDIEQISYSNGYLMIKMINLDYYVIGSNIDGTFPPKADSNLIRKLGNNISNVQFGFSHLQFNSGIYYINNSVLTFYSSQSAPIDISKSVIDYTIVKSVMGIVNIQLIQNQTLTSYVEISTHLYDEGYKKYCQLVPTDSLCIKIQYNPNINLTKQCQTPDGAVDTSKLLCIINNCKYNQNNNSCLFKLPCGKDTKCLSLMCADKQNSKNNIECYETLIFNKRQEFTNAIYHTFNDQIMYQYKNSSETKNMSAGAAAGIAVGVTSFVFILVFVLVYYFCKVQKIKTHKTVVPLKMGSKF